MQESIVEPLVPVTTDGNLGEIVGRNAHIEPDRVVMRRGSGDDWRDMTAAEFNDEVMALAKGFIASGLQPGDRLAILSRTRYEWTLTDFAAWTAGLVPVPVYDTSSPEQIAWIMSDSEVRAAVVETADHRARIAEVREQLPNLQDVWEIDAGHLAEVSAAGDQVSDEALATARDGIDRTSLATIIYTSGTTGNPKGCELTHGNFLDLSENAAESLAPLIRPRGSATLLFLPVAHVFARFVEVIVVHERAILGHSPDAKAILPDLAGFKPTFLLAVPRVFEKIYNATEQKAAMGGKGKIFHWAARVAIAWSKNLDSGRMPAKLRVAHPIANRLVFSKLREAMGGRTVYAISGGAPLGTRLGHFYRGIGLVVLEGYGLTETTAPCTVNTPDLIKIGTVGPALPGVAIRIAEDGEVLARGNNIFRGYHGKPELTAEAIDAEGWFHTGDLGSLDEDGYLSITGRKKELLVTASGKNVSPSILEDRLRAHPLVSHCIVVGDQRPFIGALITLDAEMVPTWAKTHDAGELDVDSARTNERVLAELQRAVDFANRAVSQAESIRKFTVLPGDFTEDAGYLTPSLKLRRDRVMSDFGDQVDTLYGGPLSASDE